MKRKKWKERKWKEKANASYPAVPTIRCPKKCATFSNAICYTPSSININTFLISNSLYGGGEHRA